MPLRDIVTRDLGWKMFSVALAVAIWLTVQAISKDRGLTQSLGPWENHTFTNLPVLVVSAAADVREFKVQPASVGVTPRLVRISSCWRTHISSTSRTAGRAKN